MKPDRQCWGTRKYSAWCYADIKTLSCHMQHWLTDRRTNSDRRILSWIQSVHQTVLWQRVMQHTEIPSNTHWNTHFHMCMNTIKGERFENHSHRNEQNYTSSKKKETDEISFLFPHHFSCRSTVSVGCTDDCHPNKHKKIWVVHIQQIWVPVKAEWITSLWLRSI